VLKNNEKEYYYLSELNGSFNVFKDLLDGNEEPEAITHFNHHPVRFLSIAKDNTLCYCYHGDIYTQKEGEEPQKVDIHTQLDGRASLEQIVPISGNFTEIALSPNNKECAFIFRGEIFACDLEGGITKRITNTPWQERSVSFSPDGRKLLYAAERDDSWNVYYKENRQGLKNSIFSHQLF
jgi:tricorn protease